MTDAAVVKNVLVKARKSREKISEAIRSFLSFLEASPSEDLAAYYLARNRLKDGQGLLDEVLADAKKLLGPPPAYAPEKVAAMRKALLLESGVILPHPTVDGLEAELLADEYIRSFMSPDKVVRYVREAGTYETRGKRKLENLKVRMVIDELIALAAEARILQQRAGERIQTK